MGMFQNLKNSRTYHWFPKINARIFPERISLVRSPNFGWKCSISILTRVVAFQWPVVVFFMKPLSIQRGNSTGLSSRQHGSQRSPFVGRQETSTIYKPRMKQYPPCNRGELLVSGSVSVEALATLGWRQQSQKPISFKRQRRGILRWRGSGPLCVTICLPAVLWTV